MSDEHESQKWFVMLVLGLVGMKLLFFLAIEALNQ